MRRRSNVVTLNLVICTVSIDYVIHLLKVLRQHRKLMKSDNPILHWLSQVSMCDLQ